MIRPSVKGLLLGGVVVNVRRLRDRGEISAAGIETRLGREAVDLLEQKIEPVRWYPVEAYRELVDLLWEVDGQRDPDYMRKKGHVWAKKVYDAQGYQQLEYADSAPKLRSGEQAVHQGRLIGSLIGAFWSFIDPVVDLDPDNADLLRLTFEDAADFPEANRFTIEGFLNHMVERGGGRHTSSSERPTPDRVVFRLPLRLSR